MTAQPNRLLEPLLCEPGLDPNPSDADPIHAAAKSMVATLKNGTALTTEIIRAAMEDAFGASDTHGAWIWKDAYEASEVAQIMMLNRFAAAMQYQAKSPAQYFTMVSRLAELLPTQTRRSEDMIALQQFLTPLPLAAIAAQAVGITRNDLKLSPQDVLSAVMHQGNPLTLLSGCSLRRSLVMGQPRLELMDVSPSALPELKAMGCFTEIIQWKTRVFVPLNDLNTLARILDKHPVVHQNAGQAA